MSRFSRAHKLMVAILAAVLLLGIAAVASAQRGEGYVSDDVFQGKSLDEIDALVRQISDESERRTLQSTVDFVARGGDPRALRQVDQLSIAASPPPPSLKEALAQADLVVIGDVQALDLVSARAERRGGTLLTVSVREILQGKAPETIVVQQPATVEVDVERKSATGLVLSAPSFSPPLFAGDRALLILKKVDGSEYYYALPFVGQYREAAEGKLDAIGGNPFASEFDSLTLPEGAAKVRSAAATR